MVRSAFVLFFILPLAVDAQTVFGVKAGLNIADVVMTNFVNPDVEADLRLKLGAHGGVFAQTVVDDRIGMIGEVLYTNKGVKGVTNIHLHYVALPLLVQYKLNKHFSAELGPEAAYLFAAKSAHGDVSGTYNNKFDLSLDGGLRFDSPRMMVGLRYCVGLFSVRDPISAGTTSGPDKVKYQNRVVQFSIGYKVHTLQPNK